MNMESISTDITCPKCESDRLNLFMDIHRVGDTNRIQYKYTFKCSNFFECGFKSVSYYGPEKSIDNYQTKVEAIRELKRETIESAKERAKRNQIAEKD